MRFQFLSVLALTLIFCVSAFAAHVPSEIQIRIQRALPRGAFGVGEPRIWDISDYLDDHAAIQEVEFITCQ